MKQEPTLKAESPKSLRMRFLEWRNGVLGSGRFQRLAARNPLLRPIARRRATALFDLLAGFTYTQTLLAVVEAGVLDRLSQGAASTAELEAVTGLSREAVMRLLRAGAAIDIVEEGEPGWWVLGRHGAALQGNAGAIAMIRHHRLLYADLADPTALFRDNERGATQLARFWHYSAASGGEGGGEIAAEYSQLMEASQEAVASEVVAAFPFARAKRLLDVGGGKGTFLKCVARAHPQLELGLFDLPDVVDLARDNFAQEGVESAPVFHRGDFFSDSIPQGYDLVSLVRILHDHDDGPAQQLLENIHRAMVPGARLIVAEPMADTPGARGMGDAYFGLYLWAMGSGRPRSPREIRAMLARAGFRSSRQLRTGQPVVTSLLVAMA